jgi:adenylate kinase family enzyme
MEFMKLHIIGGPGSGKTYISNLISSQTNIKNYDLDDIFWNNF